MIGNIAAVSTIEAKLKALAALRSLFAEADFHAACNALEDCAGRAVVTGMGKSGHVARKLAATFQSTGQRAVFLHPAEAAHGDMGIIEPDDIVLMISNSGETDELFTVMDHVKARGNRVIMITSRADATLAARADIVLPIPAMPEGDPIGKAPMASITCQLAVGDALAAALMAARGFTAQDFAAVHHGGYLGRSLNQVA